MKDRKELLESIGEQVRALEALAPTLTGSSGCYFEVAARFDGVGGMDFSVSGPRVPSDALRSEIDKLTKNRDSLSETCDSLREELQELSSLTGLGFRERDEFESLTTAVRRLISERDELEDQRDELVSQIFVHANKLKKTARRNARRQDRYNSEDE